MPEDTMASGSALTAWLTGYRIMVRHLVSHA